MSQVNCPRCRISREVDDERLTRPVFCESCGATIWNPAPALAELTAPADSETPSPAPTYRLKLLPAEPDDFRPAPPSRVVFVEPEPSRPPLVPIRCTLLARMGLGYVVFVSFVSVRDSKAVAPKYKPAPAPRLPEPKFEVPPPPPLPRDPRSPRETEPPQRSTPPWRPSADREG